MEVITTHLHADFDGLASMVAAKRLYPNAIMAFSGSQEKSLRDFFFQSAEYIYSFQRVKNIPLPEVRRLILVDTRQPGRIGNFAQCLANPGIEVHIFDHHPEAPGDLKGDYEVVRPVGATATIFTQIFQEQGIPVSAEDATLLGIAIYEDTGAFTFDTTTPEDLAAMSWLLARGANLQTIAQFISRELSTTEVSLLSDLIKGATTYHIQGVDVVVAKLSSAEYVDDFSLLVRRFMVMENINVLFAFAAMGDKLYLVARSRIPEVNAGKVATAFGGGGHASAASSAIKGMTLIEAEEKLLQVLHSQVRPQSMARELMSAPVIGVPPDLTINAANSTLTRYDINVLPVLREGRGLLGIISRRVTEKAIHHGLGTQPVSDFMTTDFATLPPTATLTDIQELIIGNRQRFIPVVENGEVKGVITRTDLLNVLVNDPANLPKNLLDPEGRPSVERQRNLSGLMAGTLCREAVVLLRTIGEVAEENGYTAFVVGGFVRDLLLHEPTFDIDIVVEGNGIDFANKLGARLSGKVRHHEKFATAVVILPGGCKVDIATARLEYYEHPAALPTVEVSSIKLDLFRRDFTINAMAVNLNPDRFGTLVDFFNCQNDLKDRQIRILHNLSFVEDPTRILRAIRFEQRIGFRIGRHTEKLIRSAVRMQIFGRFAGRRFFNELRLILSEENPIPALRRMAEFDVLRFFLQELKLEPHLEETLAGAQQALSWYRLLYLEKETCENWVVYLLALLSKVQVRRLNVFCEKFEVPERLRQMLITEKVAVGNVMRLLSRHEKPKPSTVHRLLRPLSIEGLLVLMALSRKETARKAVSLHVTQLRTVKTALTGKEIREMGYPPGPEFKVMLESLLAAKLDGEVTTEDDERTYLRRHFPGGGGS